MPIYELEQYELHVMKYRVTADDEADAIAKLFRGEGEPVEDSLDFVEVANDLGLSLTESPDLACRLFERGIIDGNDQIVPSIRSVRQVMSGPT